MFFFFIVLFSHFVFLLLELERSLILGANKDIGRKDILTSSLFFFFFAMIPTNVVIIKHKAKICKGRILDSLTINLIV